MERKEDTPWHLAFIRKLASITSHFFQLAIITLAVITWIQQSRKEGNSMFLYYHFCCLIGLSSSLECPEEQSENVLA